MYRMYHKKNDLSKHYNFVKKIEDEEEGVIVLRATDETLFLTKIIAFG